MPTFGLDDARLNAVIRYFRATANSIGTFRTYDSKQLTALAEPGHELFTLLKCQQCHVLDTIQTTRGTDYLAPDLPHGSRTAAARLDSCSGSSRP